MPHTTTKIRLLLLLVLAIGIKIHAAQPTDADDDQTQILVYWRNRSLEQHHWVLSVYLGNIDQKQEKNSCTDIDKNQQTSCPKILQALLLQFFFDDEPYQTINKYIPGTFTIDYTNLNVTLYKPNILTVYAKYKGSSFPNPPSPSKSLFALAMEQYRKGVHSCLAQVLVAYEDVRQELKKGNILMGPRSKCKNKLIKLNLCSIKSLFISKENLKRAPTWSRYCNILESRVNNVIILPYCNHLDLWKKNPMYQNSCFLAEAIKEGDWPCIEFVIAHSPSSIETLFLYIIYGLINSGKKQCLTSFLEKDIVSKYIQRAPQDHHDAFFEYVCEEYPIHCTEETHQAMLVLLEKLSITPRTREDCSELDQINEATDQQGNNLLHVLINNKQENTLPLLKKLGSYLIERLVDRENKQGFTPFDLCVQQGNQQLIGFFLLYKPNKSIHNASRNNVVDVARKNQHSRLIEKLQRAGFNPSPPPKDSSHSLNYLIGFTCCILFVAWYLGRKKAHSFAMALIR